MEATNIVRNVVMATALFMVSSMTLAQRDGRGHGQNTGNSFQIESSARQVAQSARSLKQSLEMMSGHRRGDRRGNGRGDRGNRGRGLGPIINAVQSVAQDARQVARDASSRMSTEYSFRQLQRSFTSYQSIARAIQNNPRLSYEVRALDSAMSTLQRDMRQGQFGGNLFKVQKMTSRFARVTANLASTVSSDLRYRRHQTYAETQALRATQDLSRQASELSRAAQNSRPALRRVKNKIQAVKMSLRQAKRALRQITTSYTVSEQLEKAKRIMRRLSDELGQGGHGGNGNHGGFDNDNHGGFNNDNFGFN